VCNRPHNHLGNPLCSHLLNLAVSQVLSQQAIQHPSHQPSRQCSPPLCHPVSHLSNLAVSHLHSLRRNRQEFQQCSLLHFPLGNLVGSLQECLLINPPLSPAVSRVTNPVGSRQVSPRHLLRRNQPVSLPVSRRCSLQDSPVRVLLANHRDRLRCNLLSALQRFRPLYPLGSRQASPLVNHQAFQVHSLRQILLVLPHNLVDNRLDNPAPNLRDNLPISQQGSPLGSPVDSQAVNQPVSHLDNQLDSQLINHLDSQPLSLHQVPPDSQPTSQQDNHLDSRLGSHLGSPVGSQAVNHLGSPADNLPFNLLDSLLDSQPASLRFNQPPNRLLSPRHNRPANRPANPVVNPQDNLRPNQLPNPPHGLPLVVLLVNQLDFLLNTPPLAILLCRAKLQTLPVSQHLCQL